LSVDDLTEASDRDTSRDNTLTTWWWY